MQRDEQSLNEVYGALADPTRRAIFELLARSEATVGSIAERFPISLHGVSKHIKVLERAGLVARTVQGREHWLRISAAPLRQASAWMEHYREFWGGRLDALERMLGEDEASAAAPAMRRQGSRR